MLYYTLWIIFRIISGIYKIPVHVLVTITPEIIGSPLGCPRHRVTGRLSASFGSDATTQGAKWLTAWKEPRVAEEMFVPDTWQKKLQTCSWKVAICLKKLQQCQIYKGVSRVEFAMKLSKCAGAGTRFSIKHGMGIEQSLLHRLSQARFVFP